ncbi:related to chitinase [Phialocephala subalpina]|uniref:chitinase n=1 Tax=Phialocephala subalpina TaxID=576137 RepID=A0A1L7XKG6_9HELO|nr:related to chitinase [Phialocephala subalpina]
MLSSSAILCVGAIYLLLVVSSSHTAAVHQRASIEPRSSHAVAHNSYANSGPFPILDISYKHILSQIGANATAAGNASLPKNIREHFATSKAIPLSKRDAPSQCGPGQPCADGSCCNSDGKCGYTSYTCGSSNNVRCLSNCNAHAMCGVNSLNAAQHCPLNLCCSYFGYCGTSTAYCVNPGSAQSGNPCQQGYGSCQVAPEPSCNPNTGTASRGRKIGYYQSSLERNCNRMGPIDIDITGFSHVIFAFASINPNSFQIIPLESSHPALYVQFTSRRSSTLQTWIAIGGYSFSDPGLTQNTWSNMVAPQGNRATFVNSLMGFMNMGGQPGDTANLVSLVQEMRAAFGNRYGISIALPPDYASLQNFNPSALSPFIDFFNFMSYDLHGPWEASILGPQIRSQSSIIDISSDLLPLWFDNVPPSKLNLGIAYYGRGYTLQNPGCADVGCPYAGASSPGTCTGSAGVLSLREIQVVIQQQGLTPRLLPDEMIKQISWGNQWIGYDDTDTIALKSNWADQHCFGGLVFWSLDLVGVGTGDSPISPSPDSTCSSTRSCIGSSYGPCCSAHGFFGADAAHFSINNGCQVTLGVCNTIVVLRVGGVEVEVGIVGWDVRDCLETVVRNLS